MKHVTRFLLGLAIVLVAYAALALVATFSQLADAADRMFAGAGTPVFWGLAASFAGLIAWPLVVYWRLPRMRVPPDDESEPAYSEHIKWLTAHLSRHPDAPIQLLALRHDLDGAMALLDQETHRLVKQTAGGVFVSTALIQNGRLDGLLMLGMQLKLVWQLAALYGLRPTPRQLVYLYGNVAGTLLLASQLDDIDFAELASPIVASVAPSIAAAAPGMQGIGHLLVNSMASGAANAFLTLRVGLIAKAYCAPKVRPVKQELRTQATREALSMLGIITKEQGTRVAQGVWRGLKTGATQTIQTVTKGSQEMAQQATDAVREAVGGAFDSTAQALKKSTQVASEAVTQAAKSTVNAAATGGQAVFESTVKAGKSVASGVTEIGHAAASTAGQVANRVGSSVTDGAKSMAKAGSSTLDAAGKLLKRSSEAMEAERGADNQQ